MFTISMGIFELEKMDICNLDVSFKNVLAFEEHEEESYLLIDFDYCFSIEINDNITC